MYSRTFSDKPSGVPPHYGGTALQGDGHRREPCREEGHKPREDEDCRKTCHEPPRSANGECDQTPPPPERGGILSRLFPFDIKGDDLLLLGIALLLLSEGCDYEYLPLLLLFLLIVH